MVSRKSASPRDVDTCLSSTLDEYNVTPSFDMDHNLNNNNQEDQVLAQSSRMQTEGNYDDQTTMIRGGLFELEKKRIKFKKQTESPRLMMNFRSPYQTQLRHGVLTPPHHYSGAQEYENRTISAPMTFT
jgi:hypothetical protein